MYLPADWITNCIIEVFREEEDEEEEKPMRLPLNQKVNFIDEWAFHSLLLRLHLQWEFCVSWLHAYMIKQYSICCLITVVMRFASMMIIMDGLMRFWSSSFVNAFDLIRLFVCVCVIRRLGFGLRSEPHSIKSICFCSISD